jgi:RimJ/RimL family protein N-acetyltransferase
VDGPSLETDRLVLRRWRDSDKAPFAALNADPTVMEYMPGLLSREQSDSLVDRFENHFRRCGFGLWAMDLRDSAEFIGFVGLSVPDFDASFTPCVEVGWRLAPEYWSRGLPTEGAREAVRLAFQVAGLSSLVSFTVLGNRRSRRVMEKLGMTHNTEDDFDHPNLREGHPQRRHVLYRLERSAWEQTRCPYPINEFV